jgi:predicted DCC family thiol-disulfide oxidoreductase YuxK
MPAVECGPVILFDGVCNLCSRTVDFVLRHDRHARFRFAALQSPAGRAVLKTHGVQTAGLNYIVLIESGRIVMRSTAILRIGRGLGGLWTVLGVAGYLLPRPLRDGIYNVVARHRYAWFGKRDTCRLPTPEEQSRFLAQPEDRASATSGTGSR